MKSRSYRSTYSNGGFRRAWRLGDVGKQTQRAKLQTVYLAKLLRRKCAGCGVGFVKGELTTVIDSASIQIRLHYSCGMAWLATNAVRMGKACWWPGGNDE